MMNLFTQPSDSFANGAEKINGVMSAVVTNNKDPEKLGRVKLKFPMRQGEEETDWVRIATMMGGVAMGSRFIPEVGDEVLVAFQLGEYKYPYVIGMLWHTEAKPPEDDGKDKNNLRRIVSRQGHELTFDDNTEEPKLTVKTKKGHILEINDKTDEIKIADSGGQHSITITAASKNEIVIKSGESTLKMNAKGEVELSSVKEIKVKSTQVNIEASASMELKASGSLNIKSDGIVSIKGSMVKIN
ncbi:phage baseplate assembly protein V [Tumebacillus sp. DT12]|uniref:Phage baseplate assembly protein V n=1 Tax=Tumebacillus lacus TaxID=2995335 RepID=A0ABT3X043_9BACL|nr:phage baseplate assembly protein V [Tumebacillus lacus]MCX7570275.1 phage baseplate assembly protein V [Tumebacillus lacus]